MSKYNLSTLMQSLLDEESLAFPSTQNFPDKWDVKITQDFLGISSLAQNKYFEFKRVSTSDNPSGESPRGIRAKDGKKYLYDISKDKLERSFGIKMSPASYQTLIEVLKSMPQSKKEFISPYPWDLSIELTRHPDNPDELIYRKAQLIDTGEEETEDDPTFFKPAHAKKVLK